MKEKYRPISIDEFSLFIIGLFVFSIQNLQEYRLYFVGFIISCYWLKIRDAETKVHKMKQKIYNVYYKNLNRDVSQEYVDGKTKHDRKQFNYELDQLEYKRKCLVDKFVVVNLVLVVLIQIFIKI